MSQSMWLRQCIVNQMAILCDFRHCGNKEMRERITKQVLEFNHRLWAAIKLLCCCWHLESRCKVWWQRSKGVWRISSVTPGLWWMTRCINFTQWPSPSLTRLKSKLNRRQVGSDAWHRLRARYEICAAQLRSFICTTIARNCLLHCSSWAHLLAFLSKSSRIYTCMVNAPPPWCSWEQ